MAKLSDGQQHWLETIERRSLAHSEISSGGVIKAIRRLLELRLVTYISRADGRGGSYCITDDGLRKLSATPAGRAALSDRKQEVE